jgi:hypothetical protein
MVGFALAQGRRAAFRRQIGFPNVKLANKARRESWKRYHELLAKFPGLRAEQALLISRKDHREQYEQLMHRTASFPLLSTPWEALFNRFGANSNADTTGAKSAFIKAFSVAAEPQQRNDASDSPVAGMPCWLERLKGFEALALAWTRSSTRQRALRRTH